MTGRDWVAKAYHEAGKAVMAAFEAIPIQSVSIVPSDLIWQCVSGGLLENKFADGDEISERTFKSAERRARVLLAGPIARNHYCYKRPRPIDHMDDWHRAHEEISRFLGAGLELYRRLEELEDETRAALLAPGAWGMVVVVATALQERRRLADSEIRGLIGIPLRR